MESGLEGFWLPPLFHWSELNLIAPSSKTEIQSRSVPGGVEGGPWKSSQSLPLYTNLVTEYPFYSSSNRRTHRLLPNRGDPKTPSNIPIQLLAHILQGMSSYFCLIRCCLWYELKIYASKTYMHLRTRSTTTTWRHGNCNEMCPDRAEWSIHRGQCPMDVFRIFWAGITSASWPGEEKIL